MGFRMRKSIKLGKGVRLNLSKSGVGMSFGSRGKSISVGPRGVRGAVGIPGTGLSYQKQISTTHKVGSKTRAPAASKQTYQTPSPPKAVYVGFLSGLFMQASEKSFVAGCNSLLKNDFESAFQQFSSAASQDTSCKDGYLLAGISAINTKRYDEAQRHLETIVQLQQTPLGRLINKHIPWMKLEFPITEQISATLNLDEMGTRFMLAEVYQKNKSHDKAIEMLEVCLNTSYDSSLLRLSLADLYNEKEENDKLIQLLKDIENEDNITLASMFYLSQAMLRKGLYDATAELCRNALRKKKDRDPELLCETRFLLAQAYEAKNQKANARKQYELIYAENPDFRDIQEKLKQA